MTLVLWNIQISASHQPHVYPALRLKWIVDSPQIASFNPDKKEQDIARVNDCPAQHSGTNDLGVLHRGKLS